MVLGIIAAAIMLGVVGLVIALMLNYAGDKFYIKTNENIEKVRDLLPGNNCGGCGYAGCDALAEAIANGKAAPDACPVSSNGDAIAAIMGSEVGEKIKKTAFVACIGDCDKAKWVGTYVGPKNCVAAKSVQSNGTKLCLNGCMGFGTCASVCEFDAIHVVNGVAKVDSNKCMACGKCVKACPNGLIELIPVNNPIRVACSSQAKGPAVKKTCSVGCLGCTLCTKQCETGAIEMKGNVPRIDYSKCTACGACASKCPAKSILQ